MEGNQTFCAMHSRCTSAKTTDHCHLKLLVGMQGEKVGCKPGKAFIENTSVCLFCWDDWFSETIFIFLSVYSLPVCSAPPQTLTLKEPLWTIYHGTSAVPLILIHYFCSCKKKMSVMWLKWIFLDRDPLFNTVSFAICFVALWVLFTGCEAAVWWRYSGRLVCGLQL